MLANKNEKALRFRKERKAVNRAAYNFLIFSALDENLTFVYIQARLTKKQA